MLLIILPCLLAVCLAGFIHFKSRFRPISAAIRHSNSKDTVSNTACPSGPQDRHDQVRIDQKPPPPQYAALLPPDRRHILDEHSLASLQGQVRQVAQNSPEIKQTGFVQGICKPEVIVEQHVTPTGFTLDEIKQFGDFPDYATLSGVPLPDASPEFVIERALARPYRPFRWPYYQTMAYAKMEPNWWLGLDRNYAAAIQQRISLYEEHGAAVLDVLSGSEAAAKELMEMAIQFLCSRYPQYFHLDLANLTFHNRILSTATNLRSTPPMLVLLHNIPEDFALMIRDPYTGLYTFRAGIILSALGWSLGTKLGLTLSEIHNPVPDYEDKLRFSMDRFFAKLPTDKPIQRGSWGLEVDKPLFVPPGDPREAERIVQDPNLTIDRIHLRVDWQTLRRLPLSGAVAFNFKALFTPLEEFRDEPGVPALVSKILRDGKESIMEYKAAWHTQHVALPSLEVWAKEQIEMGIVEEGWEAAATLDEAPFFEGWRQKWSRQQGF